jgi:hypothetical protein
MHKRSRWTATAPAPKLLKTHLAALRRVRWRTLALLAGCWHQNEAKPQSMAEEVASGRIIRIARPKFLCLRVPNPI